MRRTNKRIHLAGLAEHWGLVACGDEARGEDRGCRVTVAQLGVYEAGLARQRKII